MIVEFDNPHGWVAVAEHFDQFLTKNGYKIIELPESVSSGEDVRSYSNRGTKFIVGISSQASLREIARKRGKTEMPPEFSLTIGKVK
jgi:hypothetical protein